MYLEWGEESNVQNVSMIFSVSCIFLYFILPLFTPLVFQPVSTCISFQSTNNPMIYSLVEIDTSADVTL